MKSTRKNPRGFTMVEVLVALAIVLVLFAAMADVTRDVFGLGRSSLANLNAEWSARRALKTMVHDIRLASSLVTAGTSTIAFLADIDGDGLTESVRYGLDGSRLMREEGEIGSVIIENLGNSPSQPIFEYEAGLVRMSLILGSKTYATSVAPRNVDENE